MKLRDALIRKSERLLAEAAEQRHPNGKETLTWAKATKGTVVVTLWGIALISLQSLFDIMLPPWAQTLAILFFVNVFGNSGYWLDWRGRFHLLCSIDDLRPSGAFQPVLARNPDREHRVLDTGPDRLGRRVVDRPRCVR